MISDLYIKAFGKLQDLNLRFGESVEVIYGTNETGKSTLANFIVAMLYGFPRRQKDLEKDLRRRYRPWHAESYGGHLSLYFPAGDLQLVRQFGKTPRSDETELVDLNLGKPIELEKEAAPGEELFRLSEVAFLATSYIIDRLATDLDGKRLESILSQQTFEAYSGETWSRLKEQLEGERRELSPFRGDGGRIRELEDRAQELYRRHREALALELEVAEQADKLAELNDYLTHARHNLKEMEQLLELSQSRELLRQAKALKEIEKRAAMERMRVKKRGSQELPELPILALDEFVRREKVYKAAQIELTDATTASERERGKVRELEENLAAQKRTLDQLQKRRPPRPTEKPEPAEPDTPANKPYGLILLTLTLLSLALSFLQPPYRYFSLTAFVLFGIAFFIQQQRLKRRMEHHRLNRQKDLQVQRHRLLEVEQHKDQVNRARWQIENTVQLLEAAGFDLDRAEMRREAAAQKERRLKEDFMVFLTDALGHRPDDADLEFLFDEIVQDSLHGERQARLLAELEAQEARLLKGEDKEQFLARAKAAEQKLATLGGVSLLKQNDDAALRDKRDRLAVELRQKEQEALLLEQEIAFRLKEQTSAIDLGRGLQAVEQELKDARAEILVLDKALELGAKASGRLEASARPELQKRSARYFAELTGEKYKDILVSDALSLQIKTPEDQSYREEAYYSEGTRDLSQFALRLALADILLEPEQKPPLILDDPFLRVDYKRKRRLVRFLTDYALRTGRQIIYLTQDLDISQFAEEEGIEPKLLS